MGMVNYKKKVNIHPTTKWIMKPNTSTPKESIKREFSDLTNKDIEKMFGLNSGDTTSLEFQIAHLSRQIEKVKIHLLDHKNDKASRVINNKMINRRQLLLAKLKLSDNEKYKVVLEKLHLQSERLNGNDNHIKARSEGKRLSPYERKKRIPAENKSD